MTAARTRDGMGRETSQSVDRAMAILYTLAKLGPLRPTELSSHCDVERRALSRLLTSLEEATLLRRRGHDGAYDLGAGLVALGRLAGERNALAKLARPVLERLLGDVKCTVVLQERHRDYLSPQTILYPPGEFVIRYPEGRRIPLWEGVGRTILAGLSDREVDEYAVGGQRADLREQVEDARRTGVVVSQGEVVAGITAVGAAVLDATDSPVAVVVVVALRDGHPERFADLVKRAAAEISGMLRYS